MSHGLLLMLENIDRRKNEIVPIDSNLDAEILQDHHKQLKVRYVDLDGLCLCYRWFYLFTFYVVVS